MALSKRTRWIAAALGLTLTAPLVAVAARNPIATALLRSRLSSHGFVCDERLSVSVAVAFDGAELAPFACTNPEGRVARFELLEAATASLSAFSIAQVDLGFARVSIRAHESDSERPGSDLLRRLNLHARVLRLIDTLSRASESNLPELHVRRLEVARDDAIKANVENLELRPGTRLVVSVERIAFPGTHAEFQLTNVQGQVDASGAHFEGQAEGAAHLGPLHLSRGSGFTLDASELDGSEPRLTFERASSR